MIQHLPPMSRLIVYVAVSGILFGKGIVDERRLGRGRAASGANRCPTGERENDRQAEENPSLRHGGRPWRASASGMPVGKDSVKRGYAIA